MNNPEDGFSMLDHERAWRESVDAKLDRILELLQPVVKVKKYRPSLNFNSFWNQYPKKVGKKQCLEIWKKRNLDCRSSAIIKDVMTRNQDCAKWKGGYAPNPATYLNGDRWQDEIQKAASVAKPIPKTGPKLLSMAAELGIKPAKGKDWDDLYARVCVAMRGSDGE